MTGPGPSGEVGVRGREQHEQARGSASEAWLPPDEAATSAPGVHQDDNRAPQPGHEDEVSGDGATPGPILRANSHVHLPPNFSAFETPEQAVDLASAQGIRVLGTANYYDYRVYSRFAAAAKRKDVVPLFGNEIHTVAHDLLGSRINDPGNPGQLNLCGKALSRFDPPNDVAAGWMGTIRSSNDERARAIAARLADAFGQAGLDEVPTYAAIVAAVAARSGMPVEWISLQERHLAEAFQMTLFENVPQKERATLLGYLWRVDPGLDIADATAVQEAIRSNLMKSGGPAFVPNTGISFEDAYALILELGGIPCYPIYADAAPSVSEFEYPPETLPEKLVARGLYCAELFPTRNKPETVDRYVKILRAAGIVVVAGTDHNTRRMAPLTSTALGGVPLSAAVREIFWEGTCVLVAHQRLRSAGQFGYVDSLGRLAEGFDDSEGRIQWFAKAGQEAIMSGVPAAAQR
jgi:hypothetical protein